MDFQANVELLNTLHSKIIDSECDGECCNYIHIKLDDEVREVLTQLHYNSADIEMMVEDWDTEGNEYIDLSPVGFCFADWWDSTEGFSVKE